MPRFKLVAPFRPTGDQPTAIKKLTKNLKASAQHQVLLGVTGSGKTFTMAKVIEKIQQPTLVISHNKTLAAQLYQEFKDFFPENEVHYFVSYYDYYQPEAYLPQTDTYIEKDAKINEQLDRLRHAATQALLTRPDTIVVASVSCIYNIGSPQEYSDLRLDLTEGQKIERQALLRRLTTLQYSRADINFSRGTFRVRGNVIEVWPATGETVVKIEIENSTGKRDERIGQIFIRRLRSLKDLFDGQETRQQTVAIYPAKFWVGSPATIKTALTNIRTELKTQVAQLKKSGKLLEAERLTRRTNFDLEMIATTGYCHGMENYSRHMELRPSGEPPFTLLDYFAYSTGSHQPAKRPRDFLTFIDESHMTIPQIGAMFEGDHQRKQTLIDFGFRLPSALDNRPLKFNEFTERTGQMIYVSATPAQYEVNKATAGNKSRKYIVEQLVRPTGLLDPTIEIRPSPNQIPNLIEEIKKNISRRQRTLITTITKRLAEDLTDYLKEVGIKTHHFHSEIKTLERPEILKKLRLGEYDVVVGVNLLREGLDLPEVSLIAILDADKEGFLRNATTLIQTIGRASRHQSGRAILYADRVTASMRQAINETNRRRLHQEKYNRQHKITPQPIQKDIRPGIMDVKEIRATPQTSQEYLKEYRRELKEKMDLANRNLQFDNAARIQEEMERLKKFAKK